MSKHTTEGYTVTFNSISVGGLTNIPTPDIQRAEIDITDFDSTGIETLPAFADAGTATMECIFDPDDAGQKAMIDNYELSTTTNRTVVITMPAASTTETTPGAVSYSAYVQGYNIQGDVNDRVNITFTLRVQGDPTYTDPVT